MERDKIQYEYEWISTDNELREVNEKSKDGWKIIHVNSSPGGNTRSVLMERVLTTPKQD